MLVSAWISGEYFLRTIYKSATDGLFYIIPSIIGNVISIGVTVYIIAPRMGKYLGSLSVVEIINKNYNKNIGYIAATSSVLNCIIKIAIQFKISIAILELFFNISPIYANSITIIMLALYNIFGGMKIITITNLIQFLTFTIVTPFIALSIWDGIGTKVIIFNNLNNNDIFAFANLFNFDDYRFWNFIGLLIYFAIPIILTNPTMFQRMTIAKNITQMSKSISSAIFIYLLISIMFFWIGILISSMNQNLDQIGSAKFIIDNYIHGFGAKAMIAIGIMAMIMSTTDACVNSATVIIASDIIKPLNLKLFHNSETKIVYISSIIINIVASIIALSINNIFDLFLISSVVYAPIVTPILFIIILDIKTNNKSIAVGIFAAIISIIVTIFFLPNYRIYQILIPMFVNLLCFTLMHFITYENLIYDYENNITNSTTNIYDIVLDFFKNLKNNILKLFVNNIPENEVIIVCVGIFSILLNNFSIYNIPIEIKINYQLIYNILYYSTLIISTIFVIYPILMINKNRFFQIFLWNFGIFYILIFSNIMMFLMNDFNQLQLIVLMINLVILTSLLRWNIAFLMMIIGAVLAIYCYNNFINISSMSNLNFNIIYLLSLFAFILIIFVRPKNERYELSEIKNKHLDERLLTRDCEIEKLLDLKYEFLRNINHEFHAPMTGILTLSDTLWTKYHQLNEKQIYTSIEVITRSARRLNSLLNNILDFSRLTSLSYDLTKINLNFSNLLLERIEICKKLYIENRSVDFFLDIKKNIMVSCDKYYIEQTLDNLIINAITYSAEHGYVEITSYKDEQYVWFRIKDNGVGVANDELMDIFGVFVVGSKTKTPAGGRGIGLALAKKVIELHDGNIWAENNNSENTCFIFNIKIV